MARKSSSIELRLYLLSLRGIFGDVKRPMNGGKGLQGVTMKGENYINPFVELMKGKN